MHLTVHKRSDLPVLAYLSASIFNLLDEIHNLDLVRSLLYRKLSVRKYFSNLKLLFILVYESIYPTVYVCLIECHSFQHLRQLRMQSR